MNPTMNVTGEFVFFWYVIAPTLLLVLIFALSLAQKLATRLHTSWARRREARRPRPLRHRGSPSPRTPRSPHRGLT